MVQSWGYSYFGVSCVGTAKLNDVDPQTWPAYVLDHIAELPQNRLPELLSFTGLE